MSDKIVRELTDDELVHVSGGAAPASPADLIQMLSQILSSIQAMNNETIKNLVPRRKLWVVRGTCMGAAVCDDVAGVGC
jgi:hypothetical protein